MPDYKEEISRREKADAILLTNKSADVKLYEIFQLYKEDLKKSYPQLYYSMLEWKDTHLHELLKEISKKTIKTGGIIMSSIGNTYSSDFSICDENDIYFTGALNIIRTLDVENNFQHFSMIRDGLFPAYAIAKDTMSIGGVTEPVLAHAEELVDIFDEFEERYNNKSEVKIDE